MKPPAYVGKARHRVDFVPGGKLWHYRRTTHAKAAQAFGEHGPGRYVVYPAADIVDMGYHWPADDWDPEHKAFGWNDERSNLDHRFATYEAAGCLTIFPVIMPGGPKSRKHHPYQTPEYYAAQCQYLFGRAENPWKGPIPEHHQKIEDFEKEHGPRNWADLRKARGRAEPYRCEMLILGGEPYYHEGHDSKSYTAAALHLRKRIRERGVDLPYAVHQNQNGPENWTRTIWKTFKKECPDDLPAGIDFFHHYLPSQENTPELWYLFYPLGRAVDSFTGWWKKEYPDGIDPIYKDYLWQHEAARRELRKQGIDPAKVAFLTSEHGSRISAQFRYLDIAGALSRAAWKLICIRDDCRYDGDWCAVSEKFAPADVTYKGKQFVRCPAYFVTRMFQWIQGWTVHETSGYTPPDKHRFENPIKAVGGPTDTTLGFIELQVMEKDGLFAVAAINTTEKPQPLEGWEEWSVIDWRAVHGPWEGDNFEVPDRYRDQPMPKPTGKTPQLPARSFNLIVFAPEAGKKSPLPAS